MGPFRFPTLFARRTDGTFSESEKNQLQQCPPFRLVRENAPYCLNVSTSTLIASFAYNSVRLDSLIAFGVRSSISRTELVDSRHRSLRTAACARLTRDHLGGPARSHGLERFKCAEGAPEAIERFKNA
jgi:hypothetical protein